MFSFIIAIVPIQDDLKLVPKSFSRQEFCTANLPEDHESRGSDARRRRWLHVLGVAVVTQGSCQQAFRIGQIQMVEHQQPTLSMTAGVVPDLTFPSPPHIRFPVTAAQPHLESREHRMA